MARERSRTPNRASASDFERDGFLLLKGFATQDECAGMRARMHELVDAWDPSASKCPIFSVNSSTTAEGEEKTQNSSDYFLDSSDKIHFFLEKFAADEAGDLKPEISKHRGLNKVGHGLHVDDAVFKAYSTSDKIQSLVKTLGWKDPVLPQSMYIFKQPGHGSEVTSHQDSCFLHTTPRETCLGLWLALHDAQLDNGCLWVRPGSHKEPVRRLFKRNPGYFAGDKSQPQMVFEKQEGRSDTVWEGEMPVGSAPPSDGLKNAGFISVPCMAGDLVVIHGQVDHLSLPNTSQKQRETFQLHLIEGPSEKVRWADSNWLQYKDGKGFPSMRAN